MARTRGVGTDDLEGTSFQLKDFVGEYVCYCQVHATRAVGTEDTSVSPLLVFDDLVSLG